MGNSKRQKMKKCFSALVAAVVVAIAPLAKGDRVAFFGEHEWNARGGLLHWTYHDPQGRHVGGWLEHKGVRYQ
jgi:hypothetical protein